MTKNVSGGVTATTAGNESVAVGFVVGPETTREVVSAVLRARHLGYAVFVAHSGTRSPSFIKYIKNLEINIIKSNKKEKEKIYNELVGAAKAHSHDCIVLSSEFGSRIDYDRSLQELETTAYSVEAQHASNGESTSVVAGIPAYNEADSVGDMVRETLDYVDTVVVADDGSDDGTPAVARDSGARVVEHGDNKGYGAALQSLFEEARHLSADHLIVLDADGQHDPADIPEFVAQQRDTGAEVVVGNRFAEGAETNVPMYRQIGVQIVGIVTNLTLGKVRYSNWIRDTQCGFRCYSEAAIESLSEDSEIGSHMGASTDILDHADRREYSIEEVGTTVRYDVGDTSRYHPVQHGLTLIGNLVRTIESKHPIASVGLPGVFFMLVGTVFGYRTVTLYATNNVFPPGNALTATFFFLIGVYACFTAIILHSVTRGRTTSE